MYVDYIIQGVILLSYILVFRYQLVEINHLKSKLDTLEKFQSIFDVNKFTEYAKWLEMDFERKLTEVKIQRIDDAVMAQMIDEIKKLPDDFLKRYLELFSFMLGFLNQSDKETKELFLSKLKNNEEVLRKNLLKLEQKS